MHKKILEDWSGKPYRQTVLEKILATSPANVLDIACGGGWLGRALGVEIKTDGIDHYNKIPVGYNDFWSSDINKPLPPSVPSEYDVIACCEAITYLDSPAQLLRDAFDRLRDGGMLIISSPNPSYAGARLYYLLRGYLPAFSHFVQNNERTSHMPWIPLGWPQFWLLLGLAGFRDIALLEVAEPKPKHLLERLFGWPAIWYARNRAKRSNSKEERSFWLQFASKQANYGRRLVICAYRNPK